MKKYIFSLFIVLFSLTFISAFGFSTQTSEDGEFGFPQDTVTTEYVINASNHSDYWDTNDGSLDDIDTDMLNNNEGVLTVVQGWWDNLYCQLTGCTMEGNIIMDGNDISDVGGIFADSVTIWDTTADADGVLSIYTHDASNSFVATVNDAGSTDLYSTDQYQFRSGDDLFQFAEHSYLGTWLNIDVENDNPEFHSESGIVNFTDEDIITTGEIYSIGDLYVGDEMYVDAGTGTIYTTGASEAETSMSTPVVYTDTIATRSGSSTIFDWDSDLSQIIVHKNLNFTYNDEILGESKYNIVGVGNVSADYFKGDGSELTGIETSGQNSSSWNRSGTNVVLANSGDNVGIGTTTPSDRLEIDGDIADGGGVTILTPGNTKARIGTLGTVVPDWVGFLINAKYDQSEGNWNLDDTSLNGALFKLDVRAVGDKIGFYSLPAGANPRPDSWVQILGMDLDDYSATFRGTVVLPKSSLIAYQSGIDVNGDSTKVVSTNKGASMGTQNLDSDGFSGLEYIGNDGNLKVFTGFNNGNGQEFRFNNIATNGYIDFMLGSSSKLRICDGGDIGFADNMHLNDSKKIYLGDANDVSLNFDGSDTKFTNEVGSGDFVFDLNSGNVNISSSNITDVDYVVFDGGGWLHYNGTCVTSSNGGCI